eukprot:scaffold244195_cov78-Attheya_sp.AAC.1
MQEEIAQLKKKLEAEEIYSAQVDKVLDEMEETQRRASTPQLLAPAGRHTTTDNEFKCKLTSRRSIHAVVEQHSCLRNE